MKRLLALSAAGCIALAGAGLAGAWSWEQSQAERLDARLQPLLEEPPPTLVDVLDVNGESADMFGVEHRIWVDLDDIAPMLQSAVVAAEDRRFYEHSGVDPVGILRAAWTNSRAGHVVEGGSTLTQQLVKSTLLDRSRTLERKLDEALLARRLEARLSKDAILERYLNTVYLGSGNYGVEAAAQDYFGKPASAVDVQEAALLAALIPAPSTYDPHRHPESAREQRRRVLDDLVEVHLLSRARRDELSRLPLLEERASEVADPTSGNAYLTSVRREVRRLFGPRAPSEAGMTIHTPLDPHLQATVEDALASAMDAILDRRGRVEIRRQLTTTDDWRAFRDSAIGLDRDAEGAPMAPTPGACFEIATRGPGRSVAAGPFRIPLADDARWMQVRDPERWQSVQGLPWGQVLDGCLTDDGFMPRTTDWLTGAAVVIDNDNGHVLAMASGRGMALEGFNQATQARRQPGSTFKPYVYGAALEHGMTQVDTVLDAPVSIGHWRPENAGGYSGPIPMRDALTWSKNTVAARLIHQTGARAVVDFAHRAGVRSPIRSDLTIALGSSELTLLEHATAYATIARGGQAIEPVFIVQIDDLEGKTVARAGESLQLGEEVVTLPGRPRSVIEPAVAAQLTDMLQSVVKRGTGRRANVAGRARAGKTGTTSDYVEGWFMGFTPKHTIGVWIGSRDRRSMGEREYGSRTALPAWTRIADALDDQTERFDLPPTAFIADERGRWVVMPRSALAEGTTLDGTLPLFPHD